MPDTPPAPSTDDAAPSPSDDAPASTDNAAPSNTAQDFWNPSDYEFDSSDGDSLPEVSQILSQSTSKARQQVDRLSESLEYLSEKEEVEDRVESQEVPSRAPFPPTSPMAKEETVEASLPESPASTRRQTRKSARISKKTPTVSSSNASASAESPTLTSTPKSVRGTGEPSSKRASGTKRVLEASDDEGLPRVSASQPLPAQPSKRARRAQDAGPPPSATQPLPRPVSSSKPKKPNSLVPAPAITPKPSSSQPTPRHTPATAKAKEKAKQMLALRRRSANFWHLDGSVVVQIQNTLFRLHRSRLTQQSEFFADLCVADGRSKEMFDPEVIEERDIVDSCPVHQVKGVSVLDFERLLTALDAGIAYAINPPPFRVLASLLRAAHALSFKTILSFATHLLREMWPQELSRLSAATPERRGYALETILLAQQCDVPEVLKCAYYELLRTPGFGQDLSVYVHAESERTPLSMPETEEDEERAPPARLAASDFVRLTAAKDTLQKEWISLTRPPLPSAFPCPLAALLRNTDADGDGGGATPEDSERVAAARDCAGAQKADQTGWTARLVQNGVFEEGFVDVFEGIQRLVEMEWGEMGYCVGCVSERRDAWTEGRGRLWRRLDVLLGLRGEDEE